jgi:hypothetical protein
MKEAEALASNVSRSRMGSCSPANHFPSNQTVMSGEPDEENPEK